MKKPYQFLDMREIYANKLFRFREDLVEGPDGKRFSFSVAEVKPGSSILPLTDDGHVYLIREYKYAIKRTSTEVAAGATEEGETPLAGAQRELREELGLQAREWVEMGRLDPFTTQLVSPNYMFLAFGVEEGRRDPDEGEVLETVKIKLDEAVGMVMRSEITHAPSCTLILKAQNWLREKSSAS